MITILACVALRHVGISGASMLPKDLLTQNYATPNLKLVVDSGSNHRYFVDIKRLIRAGLIRDLDGRPLTPSYKHQIARFAVDAVRNLEIERERLRRMPNAEKAQQYLDLIPAAEDLLAFTWKDFDVLGLDGHAFLKELDDLRLPLQAIVNAGRHEPYISKAESLHRLPRRKAPRLALMSTFNDQFPDIPENHHFYETYSDFRKAGIGRGDNVTLHLFRGGRPDLNVEFAGRTLNFTRNLEIAAERHVNEPNKESAAFIASLATHGRPYTERFSAAITFFKLNSRKLKDDLTEVKRMVRPH